MRYIEFKCKNCLAPLKIPEDATEIVCDFCQSHYKAEVETKEDYGFEYAKRQAYNNSMKLKSYQEHIDVVKKITKEINAAATELNQAEAAAKNACNNTDSFFGTAAIILFVLGSVFFCGVFSTSSIVVAVVVLVISIGCIWLGVEMLKNKEREITQNRINYTEKINALADKKKELNGQLAKEKQKFEIDFIPPKYRSNEALNYMYNTLVSQRAFTIQDAMQLYDSKAELDEQKRLLQEKINQISSMQNPQLIALQQQQAQLRQQSEQIASMQRQVAEKNNFSLSQAVETGGMLVTGITIAKKIFKEIEKF